MEDPKSYLFDIKLAKYGNAIVSIYTIQVDDSDDNTINIGYDHNIKAPEHEIAEEIGEVIKKRFDNL